MSPAQLVVYEPGYYADRTVGCCLEKNVGHRASAVVSFEWENELWTRCGTALVSISLTVDLEMLDEVLIII